MIVIKPALTIIDRTVLGNLFGLNLYDFSSPEMLQPYFEDP